MNTNKAIKKALEALAQDIEIWARLEDGLSSAGPISYLNQENEDHAPLNDDELNLRLSGESAADILDYAAAGGQWESGVALGHIDIFKSDFYIFDSKAGTLTGLYLRDLPYYLDMNISMGKYLRWILANYKEEFADAIKIILG